MNDNLPISLTNLVIQHILILKLKPDRWSMWLGWVPMEPSSHTLIHILIQWLIQCIPVWWCFQCMIKDLWFPMPHYYSDVLYWMISLINHSLYIWNNTSVSISTLYKYRAEIKSYNCHIIPELILVLITRILKGLKIISSRPYPCSTGDLTIGLYTGFLPE